MKLAIASQVQGDSKKPDPGMNVRSKPRRRATNSGDWIMRALEQVCTKSVFAFRASAVSTRPKGGTSGRLNQLRGEISTAELIMRASVKAWIRLATAC